MYGAVPTSSTLTFTFLAGIHLYSPIFVTLYNQQVPAPNKRDSAHETDLCLGVFCQSICHSSVKRIICFRQGGARTCTVRNHLKY